MDKNKIIEAAAKYVAKGAFDKAIKEYQKILDADPRDVRILQKVGELHQKKGDTGQAAQYFTKVAESYTSDGFFLKAIALYKQVLKLDSSLIDVNIRLAELHQQNQLLAEAMAYYQTVANHYDKQGDTRRCLELLRKMVELDPDNVASRRKLADLFARENMNAEALVEYRRAADAYKRNNRIDDYLGVAERIAALEPTNFKLSKELAQLYLDRGDQKRALAKLQICFKADSRDIETLNLLASAFRGLGQTSKTLSVLKELARSYDDKGQSRDAAKVWTEVGEIDANDADFVARRSTIDPAAAHVRSTASTAAHSPSGHVRSAPAMPAAALIQSPASVLPQSSSGSGLRSAANEHPVLEPKSKGESITKLLAETDVYVKYGLHDKALEHLRRIFQVEPENIDAHEKAYTIYAESNNEVQAFDQLLNVLRLHTRRRDAKRAQPYLQRILQERPDHPEVPVFLAELRGTKLASSPESTYVPDDTDDSILVEPTDDDLIVDDSSEEILAAEMDPSMSDAGATPWVDDRVHFISDVPTGEGVAVTTSRVSLADNFVTGEYAAAAMDRMPTRSLREAPRSNDASVTPAPIENGRSNEQGLPEPHRQRARTTEFDSQSYARSQEQAALGDALPSAPPPEEGSGYYPTYEEEQPMVAEPASEECDEALFFLEQGLYDEAREILETVLIAYPEHPRALYLYNEMAQAYGGAQSDTGNAGDGNVDLAADLADALGDFGQGDLGDVAPISDQYQVSVDEVFSEFKKGLEKVVKPEDVDTHYDLGVAYKEMGLMDDAIAEFDVARKGCLGTEREIDCVSMVGLLHMAKEDFGSAIDAFSMALASSAVKLETEKALRYDLAGAFEANADPSRALGQYLRVQAIDASYRDVSSHVDRLSAFVAPEDDASSLRAEVG